MSVTLEPNAVKLIVVHCSATPPQMDIGVEEIRKWHVDGNKWSDIGYHAVIRRDGTVEYGRPLHQAGAHAKGWNSTSWGVCLVGGIRSPSDQTAEPNYTQEQYAALWLLLDAWRHLAPNADICGHRDLDSEHQRLKECPSFDVREAYTEYRLSALR